MKTQLQRICELHKALDDALNMLAAIRHGTTWGADEYERRCFDMERVANPGMSEYRTMKTFFDRDQNKPAPAISAAEEAECEAIVNSK